MTPDELLAELTEIRARLDTLTPGSKEHHKLTTRRKELVAAAQEASDVARNPKLLQAELEHLEKRLEGFEGEKINVPAWQMAMATINDPSAHARRINDKLDANSELDRDAVEQRITRLKKALSQ